jgi:hypothetical protein
MTSIRNRIDAPPTQSAVNNRTKIVVATRLGMCKIAALNLGPHRAPAIHHPTMGILSSMAGWATMAYAPPLFHLCIVN